MNDRRESERSRFTLLARGDEQLVRVSLGSDCTVRDALDTTQLRVRAACGGTGACGACVVRLVDGAANPCTIAEYQKLTAVDRAQCKRLACQLYPQGDLQILIDNPAHPSLWSSIPAESLPEPADSLPQLTRQIYGVAVDLGTTHIRVALWDRQRGKRIATRSGPNPQASFGADVLNRLDSARSTPERSAELANLARSAILESLRDILARDVGAITRMLAEIGQVVVVGNTAMLALLTQQGGEALLNPHNWELPVDCRPADAGAWRAAWQMPNAALHLPAPVAGFIGSDFLATLIATDFKSGPPGSMLLDIGTNTEIALWDGAVLHITSVPGGPAFESGGMRFGMPVAPGAIWQVTVLPEDGQFACETIHGSPIQGFCGSGLVDAVAVLLAAGLIKPSGRLAMTTGADGYPLLPDSPRSAINSSDIDAFQRAKAAVSAGMAILLQQAGMTWTDLRRLCVCGNFGRTLNIAHAQSLGLLPEIEQGLIELHGEAALIGCERALLQQDVELLFTEMARDLRPINLSQAKGYDDVYIDHLRLRPIPVF